MKKLKVFLAVAVAVFTLTLSGSLHVMAQERADQPGSMAATESEGAETVQSATLVIRDIASNIPRDILQNAAGIAIIPDVTKAGFIVGGRHGTGVLLTQKGNEWSAPVFASITGGSIGLQAGVERRDLVLVFQDLQSMNELIGGDLNLGVDATVVAGPVGASSQASTRGADVLSYEKRADGLFAGVALTGAVLSLDDDATRNFYSLGSREEGMAYYPSADEILTKGTGELKQIPPSARELQQALQQSISEGQQVR